MTDTISAPTRLLEEHLTDMWNQWPVPTAPGTTFAVVIHQPSGAWFTVLRSPEGKIQTLMPLSEEAERLINGVARADPTLLATLETATVSSDHSLVDGWANDQTWQTVLSIPKPAPLPVRRRRRVKW